MTQPNLQFCHGTYNCGKKFLLIKIFYTWTFESKLGGSMYIIFILPKCPKTLRLVDLKYGWSSYRKANIFFLLSMNRLLLAALFICQAADSLWLFSGLFAVREAGSGDELLPATQERAGPRCSAACRQACPTAAVCGVGRETAGLSDGWPIEVSTCCATGSKWVSTVCCQFS